MCEVTLEFSGGAETLFNNQKRIKIVLDKQITWSMKSLLPWILENLLKDCPTPELLVFEGSVRPGILVLINDCDWEIMDGLAAPISNGDVVTFLSTLHGG
uniref:Ubiquitin-related modifier 1 homolog n=1 Tax=Rhabditophanes sp. KR3021 TaxID=114890 RepID=A0AC35UFS1_9BILA